MAAADVLTAPADASAAEWVLANVRDFNYTVGSIVPTVFEAYARVFHPAQRGLWDASEEVRWTEVAAGNSRVMHPAAEWGSLTGSWQIDSQPGLWEAAPDVGRLPAMLGKRLADVLAGLTELEQGRYGVWEGWGRPALFVPREEVPEEDRQHAEEDERRVLREGEVEIAAWRDLLDHAPKFALPHRTMHLLTGALSAVSAFYENHRNPPSLWWPEDRAWCVGTDIDLMTTYVGGSRRAIEELLADEQLEVLPVSVDQGVTWKADTINPLPEHP
ncbi:MAG TPA: hypothetical protein VMB51_03990 [Solirubrobacteraceae bacterium]|nr:hypothetical protein [Solirubrobacteraceae bacterium]